MARSGEGEKIGQSTHPPIPNRHRERVGQCQEMGTDGGLNTTKIGLAYYYNGFDAWIG